MKSVAAPPAPPTSRPTKSSVVKLPPTSRPAPSAHATVVAPPIPTGFAGKSLSLPFGRPTSAVVRPPANTTPATDADGTSAMDARADPQTWSYVTPQPAAPSNAAQHIYAEATYEDEALLAPTEAGLQSEDPSPEPPEQPASHIVHRSDGGDAMEQLDATRGAAPTVQPSTSPAHTVAPSLVQEDDGGIADDDDYLTRASPVQQLDVAVPVVAPAQPTMASTALVVDDDSDDDAFFPSNPVMTPSAFRQSPPNDFILETNQTTMETPQPLRQLFAVEEPASPPPDVREALSVEGSTEFPAETEPQDAQRSEHARDGKPPDAATHDRDTASKEAAVVPVVQPAMDFSTEPIEHWQQLEEAQREKERAARRKRQSATSITDTIKRLSKPKSISSSAAARPPTDAIDDQETSTALRNTAAASAHPTDGHVASPAGISMPQGLSWGALNAPTSDRPNETHYYLMVHVLGSKHRLALPKKATMAAVAEALDLTDGALRRQDGSFVPWSSTVGQLGLQPGIAGRTHFKFVSSVEREEEIERSALIAECIGWTAHRLAFSEWVIRCSDQISRHVFFDATDVFEDIAACTSS